MQVEKVVVVGLGRFGYSLCKALTNTNVEVIAVDIDQEKVEAVEDYVAFPAVMDTGNLNSLKSLGVTMADLVIVSIGENFESSLLTISYLQQLGVKRIMARVINDVHKKILDSMGITETISPEEQSGIDIAQQLTIEGVESAVDLGDGYSFVEMLLPEPLVGVSLGSSGLRDKYNLNLITIKRRTENTSTKLTTLGTLTSDFTFEKGDIMILFGREKEFKSISNMNH